MLALRIKRWAMSNCDDEGDVGYWICRLVEMLLWLVKHADLGDDGWEVAGMIGLKIATLLKMSSDSLVCWCETKSTMENRLLGKGQAREERGLLRSTACILY